MAVVIRSNAGNEGRTVTCLQFIGPVGIIEHKGIVLFMPQGDYWLVDRQMNMRQGGTDIVYGDFIPYVPDSLLMPISGYKEPMVVKEEECEPA
jgi:hypothetical protein